MSAWNGLGINIGNENNGRTQEQWDADFRLFKGLGITKVRILQSSYNWWVPNGDAYNYNDYSKALALRAKQWDFHTIWGTCAGRKRLDTEEDWDDFVNNPDYGTLVHSDWAAQNGIDQFQYMNEEESYLGNSVYSMADMRDLSRTLATALKARHPNLPISRNIDNVNWFTWTTDLGGNGAGIGDNDYLGLNCYATYVKDNDFNQRATAWKNAFGSQAIITEWNCSASSGEFGSTAKDLEDQTIKIAIRQKMLKDLGYDAAYFFCARWENSGADDQFAVFKKDGTKRLWWNTLATNNGRRFFIEL